MQQQKLQIHGHHHHHGTHSNGDSRNRSATISSNSGQLNSSRNNSSLHRFSVDALAGTQSSAGNDRKHNSNHRQLNVTSDEDGSITSWDDEIAGTDDDDDIDVDDVGPLSPTAVSTTSDSSRGGSSPSNAPNRTSK